MNERNQLQTQWATLNVTQRKELFRSWIVSETNGISPSNIFIFHYTGGSLVNYNFSADLVSWQAAVADRVFTNALPNEALAVGDALIEVGHLFEERRRERDELSEEEFEDESAEADEYLFEQAIENAIDALEEMENELQSQLGEAEEGFDDGAVDGINEALDELHDLIDALKEKINALDAVSG